MHKWSNVAHSFFSHCFSGGRAGRMAGMDWFSQLGWLVVVVLGACLAGSIPFGFLAGKMRGIDIRKHGSGNIGATNVFRTLGKGPGITVFVLDALKGFGAARLAIAFWPDGSGGVSPELAGIFAAVAAILGHNFTPWLGFKGGKGIATSAGALLGLLPLAVLGGAVVWGVVFFLSRYVSLASIAAAAALPLITWLLFRYGNGTGAQVWFALAIGVLAIWRHRSNIIRLLQGTENRFEKRQKNAS
jgi:glycerol-3-phosphate acyltransferase PlsY